MFTLDQVVPWGRSFDEYRRMFDLSSADLEGRILGCADGPPSSTAEATQRGAKIVSVDPLYRFNPEPIRERVKIASTQILEQMRLVQDEFVWDTIRSVDDLGTIRMNAMTKFLGDFEEGRTQGR